MNTYICILRGINVSGHKIIKMDELKNMFQKLKFNEVQTYIQSGNVIFKTNQSNQLDLTQVIQSKILEVFGFEVPVLIKSFTELKHIFDNNPFLNGRSEDLTKLHVTFLSDTPDKVNIDKLSGVDYGTDEYKVIENVVYLFCPINGYGNTKLSNQYLESKLKLNATTRNWKTISKLVELAK